MKNIRTLCISLLLVIFLFITVFMPPTVSRIKDRMLIGQVTTQRLTDTKVFTKSDLNMEEKIALIMGYILGQDNIIMVSQDRPSYVQGEKEDMARLALNELKKLKRLGLLPPIEISEAQNITFSVQSYTNIDDPSINTEIWDIDFTIDKNVIEVTMDADNHLILRYMVWSKEALHFSPKKDTLEQFSKYLGIKPATIIVENKSDQEQYKYSDRTQAYRFIQINEEKIYGIQIISITD